MITIKLDIYSVLIFLGAVQGLFLAGLFFKKKDGNHFSNALLAFILICFSIIILDIFSGYTGYVTYYIYMNNVSDPFVFFLGPLCYLYTRSQINDMHKIKSQDYLHFIIPLFITLYMILYFIQPDGFKYNDFLSAYHPEIHRQPFNPLFDPDPIGILPHIAKLMILHLAIYAILSVQLINRELKQKGASFLSFTDSEYAWLRILLSGFILALLLFVFIKIVFYNDLGDHIIATYTSIMIYSISIYVLRQKNPSNEE